MKTTLLGLVKNKQPPFKVKVCNALAAQSMSEAAYREYEKLGYFIGTVIRVIEFNGVKRITVQHDQYTYDYQNWATHNWFQLVEEDYMGWPCYL